MGKKADMVLRMETTKAVLQKACSRLINGVAVEKQKRRTPIVLSSHWANIGIAVTKKIKMTSHAYP